MTDPWARFKDGFPMNQSHGPWRNSATGPISESFDGFGSVRILGAGALMHALSAEVNVGIREKPLVGQVPFFLGP